MQKIILKIIALGFVSSLFSCQEKEGGAVFQPTLYTLNSPDYFPKDLNIPVDNALTVEGINLGRYLFYDGRLSGRTEPDSLMSCASCHVQAYGFESGMNNPRYKDGKMVGLTGIESSHSMLPLVNLVYNKQGYLWNGRINLNNKDLGSVIYNVPALLPYTYTNIESTVWMMIAAPHEANGKVSGIDTLIASLSMYPPMFEAAFGTPEVSMDRICKAVAQFVRTLNSSNSKFDKYLRGEAQLTDDEMRGYILFTTEEGADCFHCHGGAGNALFSTYAYLNNGLDASPTGIGDRFSYTNNSLDAGAYKVPTLRNIAQTAPYMHDGRYTTLEQVIDQYSEGVKESPTLSPLMHHAATGGVQLTEQEKIYLKAFLLSLTDTEFLTHPQFSKPQDSRLP